MPAMRQPFSILPYRLRQFKKRRCHPYKEKTCQIQFKIAGLHDDYRPFMQYTLCSTLTSQKKCVLFINLAHCAHLTRKHHEKGYFSRPLNHRP